MLTSWWRMGLVLLALLGLMALSGCMGSQQQSAESTKQKYEQGVKDPGETR